MIYATVTINTMYILHFNKNVDLYITYIYRENGETQDL